MPSEYNLDFVKRMLDLISSRGDTGEVRVKFNEGGIVRAEETIVKI